MRINSQVLKDRVPDLTIECSFGTLERGFWSERTAVTEEVPPLLFVTNIFPCKIFMFAYHAVQTELSLNIETGDWDHVNGILCTQATDS